MAELLYEGKAKQVYKTGKMRSGVNGEYVQDLYRIGL